VVVVEFGMTPVFRLRYHSLNEIVCKSIAMELKAKAEHPFLYRNEGMIISLRSPCLTP